MNENAKTVPNTSDSSSITGHGVTDKNEGSSSTVMGGWTGYGESRLIEALIFDDRIEFVFRADSMVTLTSYPPQYPLPKIWKEVYRAVDGKITKVETIDGVYVPAQDVKYYFE